MPITPKVSVRIPQSTLDFLDVLGAYLNPDNPSRAHAISHLARQYTPPSAADPSSLKVRVAHRELTQP